MKKICAVLLFVVATFLCSVSYGDDRFEYVSTGLDYSVYYLDKYSIVPTNTPNVFRFWCQEVVSETRRKELIASKNFSNSIDKLAYNMAYYEINIVQNTILLVETYMYDSYGNILDHLGLSDLPPNASAQDVLRNIPPNSTAEKICNAVKRIIQNNTQRTPSQPFVAPQPQPQPRQLAPQPQTPLSNQQLREEYGKLLEYVSWLIAQPDYPEFEAWVSLKAQQAGLSLNDLSSGIEEYVRQSGGRYSDIRAMLAGWYREFYMERYGGR